MDGQMIENENYKLSDDCKSVADEERRKFLASAGRFALVTGPAVTLLLSTSLNSKAIAASGSGAGSAPQDPPSSGKPWWWFW